MNVKYTSHAEEYKSLLEKVVKRQILPAMGDELEGFAKSDPAMPVATGRARNSITWGAEARQNITYSYTDNDGEKYEEHIGEADTNSVAVGSNVEYFPDIEEGGRHRTARHVLKTAVTAHGERLNEIVKAALQANDIGVK